MVTKVYAGAPEKSIKKGQDMPKLCVWDNGKKNTSAKCIGHFAPYVAR